MSVDSEPRSLPVGDGRGAMDAPGTAWAVGASSRRDALTTARRSRRPSRLGRPAGTASEADYPVPADAGFPGLLRRSWDAAVRATDLPAALTILLTLDGHVPGHIGRQSFTTAQDCAFRTLFESRPDTDPPLVPSRDVDTRTEFVGCLGLTVTGRVVLSVPAQAPLDDTVELVGGVMRVKWTASDLAAYRVAIWRANERARETTTDSRTWLAGQDLSQVLDRLTEATLRTAPVTLYSGERHYTNFRERNTVTGKTLWPGHPDCTFGALTGVPLDLWSDDDVALVTCLTLLIESGGFMRIEEANGTQLTVDRVADVLERTRTQYNAVLAEHAAIPAAPGSRPKVAELEVLAAAIAHSRPEVMAAAQLYREIHGPLMHKIERVAARADKRADAADAELAERLRDCLPVHGRSLAQLAEGLAEDPDWLVAAHRGFGTGLESLVHAAVQASTAVFDADFAMSRGMRPLGELVTALRSQDWATVAAWDLPRFFCCVVPSDTAARMFGDSRTHLADISWAISARMQYNSWHFLVANLPDVPAVSARDYFVPPGIPDIALYSDQHHHGHVAAKVRFTVRSPQPVRILDTTLNGFLDLRLLRCEGEPFNEQDIHVAQRVSGLLATATRLAGEKAAKGVPVDITAFDSRWHWDTIAG